jgi:fructokinase
MGAFVKVSEVDWERLYGLPLTDYKQAAQHFLDLGAAEVCVTLGGEGCYVATKEEAHFLAARPVEVKDTTGAGDAFWSGYLTAWCDGLSLLAKAKAGRRMAELKLGYFGPLPNTVDRKMIYE